MSNNVAACQFNTPFTIEGSFEVDDFGQMRAKKEFVFEDNVTFILDVKMDNSGILKDGQDFKIIDSASHGYFDRNEIQILDIQQAAIADAALTLASVQSQLNLALAALRAHGLIAT